MILISYQRIKTDIIDFGGNDTFIINDDGIDFMGTAGFDFIDAGIGLDTIDLSSITTAQANISVDDTIPFSFIDLNAVTQASVFGFETYVGTQNDDSFIISSDVDRSFTGNAGSDTYQFGLSFSGNTDTITDFAFGEDVIDLNLLDTTSLINDNGTPGDPPDDFFDQSALNALLTFDGVDTTTFDATSLGSNVIVIEGVGDVASLPSFQLKSSVCSGRMDLNTSPITADAVSVGCYSTLIPK